MSDSLQSVASSSSPMLFLEVSIKWPVLRCPPRARIWRRCSSRSAAARRDGGTLENLAQAVFVRWVCVAQVFTKVLRSTLVKNRLDRLRLRAYPGNHRSNPIQARASSNVDGLGIGVAKGEVGRRFRD